jgi:hypothetical protein
MNPTIMTRRPRGTPGIRLPGPPQPVSLKLVCLVLVTPLPGRFTINNVYALSARNQEVS